MPKSSAFPNGIPIENFARILYEYGGSLIFQRLRDVFNHILVKGLVQLGSSLYSGWGFLPSQ